MFKKRQRNMKKNIHLYARRKKKKLIGKESNLFALHALVSSSLAALNIIHHPPADCKSGIWFPFYI